MSIVIHKLFGEGVIIKEDGNYITVKFIDGSEKRFVIPQSFETGLLTVDSIIQRKVDEEKEKIEEERKEINIKSEVLNILKDNPHKNINQVNNVENIFVLKNQMSYYKNINGYHICSIYGENIGIVWKHKHKKGELAEGQAEIRFYDEFRKRYGTWRRMFINKNRIMFDHLEKLIQENNEFEITIDSQKGS